MVLQHLKCRIPEIHWNRSEKQPEMEGILISIRHYEKLNLKINCMNKEKLTKAAIFFQNGGIISFTHEEFSIDSSFMNKIEFRYRLRKINFRITNKSLHKKMKLSINILTTSVSHHIETSQLICYANQLTGFYMIGNMLFSGLRVFKGVFRTL